MRCARVLLVLSCLVVAACSDDESQSAVSVVDCVVGYDDAHVPAGSTIVLDAVALPTATALQVVESVDRMLWSKQGLIVATGREVELRVADDWRGRFAFSWGRLSDPVERIRVPACAHRRGSPWLAFTGGYFVTEPSCVALVVTVDDRAERVEIGMGAPCANQAPPGSPPRPSS